MDIFFEPHRKMLRMLREFNVDFMLVGGFAVNYSEAEAQALKTTMENIDINIIHIHHLVLSKISNNRTKDKLDVEELRKIINKNKTD